MPAGTGRLGALLESPSALPCPALPSHMRCLPADVSGQHRSGWQRQTVHLAG